MDRLRHPHPERRLYEQVDSSFCSPCLFPHRHLFTFASAEKVGEAEIEEDDFVWDAKEADYFVAVAHILSMNSK